MDLFASAGIELESDKKKRLAEEAKKREAMQTKLKSVKGNFDTLKDKNTDDAKKAQDLLNEAEKIIAGADEDWSIEETAQPKIDEAAKIITTETNKQTPKPSSKSSSSTATKKTGDAFKVTTDTKISYAGEVTMITEYFTEEEIKKGTPDKEGKSKKITKEMVQAKLEERYAELVPDLTELVYFKEKDMIVPVLKAGKKGNTSVHSEVSQIPFNILEDFVVVANHYASLFKTEVHADIYHDLDTNEFFLDFPEQQVSPVIAEVTEAALVTAVKFMGKRVKKVMEIHSHHYLPAFPSPTDDASERAPIYYTIVGKLGEPTPHITCRTFNTFTQEHFNIDPSELFADFHKEFNMDKEVNYSLENVKVLVENE